MTAAMQVLPKLKARRRARLLRWPRTRAGDHVVGREGIPRARTVRDPVAQRCEIALGVDSHPAGLVQLLHRDRRKLREHVIGQRPRSPWEGRLGRADD